MDAQIHGAIVGGVLAGIVVSASIAVEHRLLGRHERRTAIERAVLALRGVDSIVAAGLVGPDVRRDEGSRWAAARDEALQHGREVRLLARGRRWRTIRVAADEYLAAIAAAIVVVDLHGRALPERVAFDLMATDITVALFGATGEVTGSTAWRDRWEAELAAG